MDFVSTTHIKFLAIKVVCDVVIPTDRGFVLNPYILSF